jgi:hypothetical protein
MRDSAKADDESKPESAGGGQSAKGGEVGDVGDVVGYVAPLLTKVGNVRNLLAGDGGTVTDADPTALDPHQSSPL